MTLAELQDKLAKIEESREVADKELERLSDVQGRLDYLDRLQENAFSLESIAYMRSHKTDEELTRDLYRDLELRVTVQKDGSAELTGVFGSQVVEAGTTANSENPPPPPLRP